MIAPSRARTHTSDKGESVISVIRGSEPADVPRETISINRTRGTGLDWSPAEIAILSRGDLRPREMWLRLPHRTRRAIYIKRHRLGVAQRYRRQGAHQSVVS